MRFTDPSRIDTRFIDPEPREIPVFSEGQNLPQVWFVSSQCDHYGNRTFTVCKLVGDTPIFDLEIRATYAAPRRPWWKFWDLSVRRPYEERVRAAYARAQRRAWELNEQVSVARGLDTKMQHELAKARHYNPHD